MLQKLFIILSLILILPDIYIYRMFISKLQDVSPVLKLLYWLPTLLLFIGLIVLIFFSGQAFIGKNMIIVGWFAIVLFLFIVPKLLFTLSSIIGIPFNYFLHWPKMPFTYIGILLALVSAGGILYGAFVGRTHFVIKEVSYSSPQLPEDFKGYRIVQLSDIHIGSWEGNASALQRAVDLVNAQQPDLIVFTGDLVNHRADELDQFQTILSKLHAKDGIYSVLGNHDYGPYYQWETPRQQVENLQELKQREADMGWTLLNNEHIILHKGNDSIALIGVENEGEPPFSQHGDLSKAKQGTDGMFQILLSHNPTHWQREVLSHSKVNLMLAGHTHGMQMALGHHSPSSFIYPEWGGMYKKDGRGLYVNVGLGFVGLPFRFGVWPEITVITLE